MKDGGLCFTMNLCQLYGLDNQISIALLIEVTLTFSKKFQKTIPCSAIVECKSQILLTKIAPSV